MEIRTGDTALPGITVSVGLAMRPEHGEEMEPLLKAADHALYSAKRAGRDRLVVSEALAA